ncbi:hypothetical protein ACGF8B_37930 [Streptomyces sp. NPDC047917]|uniref:hypothetical protein n=1 Tax=Streptomyces sp. NPDC047917 TaxID=3365491 RepID=UPI00371E114B
MAGTGKSGYDGDDKDALTAKLSHPEAVAVDAAGNFYIAESMNHRVRKVTVAAHGPQTGVRGV